MNDLLPRLAECRARFLSRIKTEILWVKKRETLKEVIKKRLPSTIEGAVSVADIDNASSIQRGNGRHDYLGPLFRNRL